MGSGDGRHDTLESQKRNFKGIHVLFGNNDGIA
jgi:hypothetical protein